MTTTSDPLLEILPGLEVAADLLNEAFPGTFMVAEGAHWVTYPAAMRLEGSRLRFLETMACFEHANCRELEVEGAGMVEYLSVYVGDRPRFRRPFRCSLHPRDTLIVHLVAGGSDGRWEQLW